jgi:preprotein translocase SecE subunit
MLDLTGPKETLGSFNLEEMVAEKDTAPKPKRRMKQTMREKTATGAVQANKQSRVRKVLGKVLGVIAWPFRPVGRALARFEKLKPVHIVGLILVPPYFRNSWRELRQVTWPSRKETRQLTSAVLIFAIIFGVLIAITDYGLDKLFKKVILKQ